MSLPESGEHGGLPEARTAPSFKMLEPWIWEVTKFGARTIQHNAIGDLTLAFAYADMLREDDRLPEDLRAVAEQLIKSLNAVNQVMQSAVNIPRVVLVSSDNTSEAFIILEHTEPSSSPQLS